MSTRCTIIVRHLQKGTDMVTLLTSDIVAITIALTVSVGLVISTAVANYRLTEKVRQLRQQLHSQESR